MLKAMLLLVVERSAALRRNDTACQSAM
jgi:hypothetical protein